MAGDLHCHTRLSDSSVGIEDLIALARKRGIDTIAITDRDCLAGTVRGKVLGERKGITVIPGVEISAYDSKRDCYADILCYLSDSPDRLEGLCHRNIIARKRACQLMTLKVAQKYPITPELVLKCAAGSTSVFIQHIMHALMECGLTDKMYGELYHELFSPESPDNVIVKAKYPEPSEVLAAIHEAGGIAVLSHPGKYDNFELLDELIAEGLDGIEVWHPSNDEQQQTMLATKAKKAGLLALGGTEFMGMYSLKPIALGEYITPDTAVKALNSYKAKLRRKAQVKK